MRAKHRKPKWTRGTKAERNKLQRAKAAAKHRQFTLFPKLPPELRVMIWRFALPSPRLLTFEVRIGLNNTRSLHTAHDFKPFPVLQASSESRWVALKAFDLINLPTLRYPFYYAPTRDIINFAHTRHYFDIDLNWLTSNFGPALTRGNFPVLAICFWKISDHHLAPLRAFARSLRTTRELIICRRF